MKKKTLKIWLIAVSAAALVTLLAGAGAFRRVDKWAQDLLFQQPAATDSDIVIIGIDERALTALGPYHAWGRSVMAQALEALAGDESALPAVVAVDALFAGNTQEDEDAHLAAAAEKLPHVVVGAVASFGTAYTPGENGGLTKDTFAVLGFEGAYGALRAVTQTGHINAMYDQDGVMRHGLLYVNVPSGLDAEAEGKVYSMAWETARLFLESRGGEAEKPYTDKRGFFYIPFTAAPGGYSDGYSLADLLAGEISPSVWADKIVLIGPYAVALQDAYFTPISHSAQMYGVEVQANVIQSFLEGNFKREAADGPQLAILFLLSFAAMALFLRVKPSRTWWAALLLAAAGPASAFLLYALGWVAHALWHAAAAAVLYALAVAWHYAQAALERQRVTHTFERYVAPEIVREILREGTDSLNLGGSMRDIAVLFVDIRGFTAMSERLDPEKVVFILNQYLTMTSACVESNGGTLDKFVGDAAMAFWGAPLPQEDPVYAAAKTAVDIVKGAEELSARLKSEIGEELRVGVGVHWGKAVVGNMGSLRHMDYTAIGDTVNTASRLESNAPGGMVYISRAVADALGARARVTSLGESVKLKGKSAFEVLTLDELI